MTYEEAIKWFSDQMLFVLKDNGHKEPIPVDSLFDKLLQETTELHTEIIKNDDAEARIKEAIDVANFALMIALDAIGKELKPIYKGR